MLRRHWLKAALLLLGTAYAVLAGKWALKSLWVSAECVRFARQLRGALKGTVSARLAAAPLPEGPSVEAYSAKLMAARRVETRVWKHPVEHPATGDAIGVAFEALRKYPNDEFLNLELATYLAGEESLDATLARRAYDRLITVAPRNAMSYYCAASLEARKGQAGWTRVLRLIEAGNQAPEFYSPYWRRRQGVVRYASGNLAPEFICATEYTYVQSGDLVSLGEIRRIARITARRSMQALNAGNDALAARLAEACIGMGKKITQTENLITVLILRSVHSYGIDALLDVARYRGDEDLAKQMFYARCASWLLHRECEKTPTPECDRMLRLSCKVLFPVAAMLMKARLIPAPAIYLAGSVLSFYLVTLVVTHLLAACVLRAAGSRLSDRGVRQPREAGLVLALAFLAVAVLHAAILTRCLVLAITLGSSVLFATCTWLAGRDASARLRPLLWLTLIAWLVVAPLTGRYAAYVEDLPDRAQNETSRLRPLPTANRETYEETREATIEAVRRRAKGGYQLGFVLFASDPEGLYNVPQEVAVRLWSIKDDWFATEAELRSRLRELLSRRQYKRYSAEIMDRSHFHVSTLRYRLRLLMAEDAVPELAGEIGRKLGDGTIIDMLSESYGPSAASKLQELMTSPELKARAAIALAKLRDRSALPTLNEVARHLEAGRDVGVELPDLVRAYAHLSEIGQARRLIARRLADVGELAPSRCDTFDLRHALLSLPPASAGDAALVFLRRVGFDSVSVYAGLGDCTTPEHGT